MNENSKDYFYRISLKAIIRNDEGEILVVKEKGSQWTLPGGGLDHGEDIKSGLARELYEEALFQSEFTYEIVGAEPMYLERKIWQMCLYFEIKADDFKYGLGEDADEIAFIDPEQLKNSEYRSELLVYKYSLL